MNLTLNERQQEIFDRVVDDFREDPTHNLNWVIYGKRGVGKTTLLNAFVEYFKREPSIKKLIVFDSHLFVLNPLSLLFFLAEELGVEGCRKTPGHLITCDLIRKFGEYKNGEIMLIADEAADLSENCRQFLRALVNSHRPRPSYIFASRVLADSDFSIYASQLWTSLQGCYLE